MKEYGQNLKKRRSETINQLNNIDDKIDKRFLLIKTKYSNYITNENLELIKNDNLSKELKLKIIINTEKNYIEQNTKQLDFFKST